MSENATSFGRAVDAYDSSRPAYPTEAIEWMLPPAAREVVDVGAGTGKLAGVVAAAGRSVTAVDPDPVMLERLAMRHPAIPTLVGTAESLPLPDASFDAAVFGQSWHWVDPPRASREVARVLRPGGALGLIWNMRDTAVPWVEELTGIMHGSAAEELIAGGGPTVGEPFGAVETRLFRWANPITVDGLVELVSSRSYIITAPERERAEILERVRELGGQVADHSGALELPYVTHAFRAAAPA